MSAPLLEVFDGELNSTLDERTAGRVRHAAAQQGC